MRGVSTARLRNATHRDGRAPLAPPLPPAGAARATAQTPFLLTLEPSCKVDVPCRPRRHAPPTNVNVQGRRATPGRLYRPAPPAASITMCGVIGLPSSSSSSAQAGRGGQEVWVSSEVARELFRVGVLRVAFVAPRLRQACGQGIERGVLRMQRDRVCGQGCLGHTGPAGGRSSAAHHGHHHLVHVAAELPPCCSSGGGEEGAGRRDRCAGGESGRQRAHHHHHEHHRHLRQTAPCDLRELCADRLVCAGMGAVP